MIMPAITPGHRRVLVVALFLILSIGLPLSCGKKAPPLPPLNDGNAVAPPTDLAYTLNGENATITWAHKVDPQNAKIPPRGFRIFVATKDLNACEGCPFIFKLAGTAPMPEMRFQHTLTPGLHYYFRVQAFGKNDIASTYSETVYIDFQ